MRKESVEMEGYNGGKAEPYISLGDKHLDVNTLPTDSSLCRYASETDDVTQTARKNNINGCHGCLRWRL